MVNMGSCYIDIAYRTVVSNNHNSQQLVSIKVASKLTKVAKVAHKSRSTTKIARSRQNVKIAQKMCCARSEFSGGSTYVQQPQWESVAIVGTDYTESETSSTTSPLSSHVNPVQD